MRAVRSDQLSRAWWARVLGSTLALALVTAHPGADAAPPSKAPSDKPTLAVFEIHYGTTVLPRTETYANRVANALAHDGAFALMKRTDAAELMSKTFPRPQGGDVEAQLADIQTLFKKGEGLFFQGKFKGGLEAVERASFKLGQLVEARVLTEAMRRQFIATELLLAQLYLRDDEKTKADDVMEGVVRRVGDDPSINTDTYHPEPVKLFKAVLKRLETARKGALTVKSDPEGAQVLVNGTTREGTTPTTLSPLYTGEQIVQVVAGERRSRPQRVFVSVAGETPQVLDVDIAFDEALMLESDAFGLRFTDGDARDKQMAALAARLAGLVDVDYVALVGLHSDGGKTHLEGFLVHGKTADVVRQTHAKAAVRLPASPAVVAPGRVVQLAKFLQTGEGPPAEDSPWYTSTLGWVLTGAGVAAVVVGGVVYGSYLDNKDVAECDPAVAGTACKPLPARLSAKDDAEGDRTVAYTLWGVGAASIVGGIIVFALHEDGDDDGSTADAGPTLTPMFTDTGAGVSAGFRF